MQRIHSFLNLLFAFLSITSLCFTQMPMGGMNGMPMPSPQELQQIEAEIDNFVRSLPPEQQAQFYKDVEELTGIMEQMSPEELNSFVENVFTDAGLMEPMQEEPAKAEHGQPEPPKEEKPVTTPVTTAPAGPTQQAIALIDSLISSTEEFLRKAQIIPELPGKMDKWVAQHKLLEVAGNIDWEKIQNQIDEFNALLYTLKDKDPKTGEYRHIGDLIKQEALYNNLSKLKMTLEQFVPQVTVPEFGLDKVSKESRAAIRDTLSGYLEAFYLLNVIEEIKKVKQPYEPRAKELTEEEKQFAERAQKEAEKPRKAVPAERSSGSSGVGAGYYGGGYDAYDDYYSGGGYGSPYYGTPSYSTPSYSASSYDYDRPSAGPSASSGAAPAAQPSAAKPGDKKEPSAKDAVGKPGDKKVVSDDKRVAPAADVKHDGAKDRQLGRIASDLEDIRNELEVFDKVFTKFKNHLDNPKGFEKEFINDQLADVPIAIQNTQKKLKKATEAVKSFKKSISSMNKATQDHYKKELINTLKDEIEFYNKLGRDIIIVKEAWNKGYKNRVHTDKRYVFFGEDKDKASKEVTTKVTDVPPVTMFDLKETIEAFLKEAK